MNTNIISIVTLTAFLICQVSPVTAQAFLDPQRSAPLTSVQAQQLWQAYRDNAGNADGKAALEQIEAARTLPATKANAAAVLALLRSNVSRDEKVVLIRIAGAQVVNLDDQQARADIKGFLSELAVGTEDPVLGKAAALMYSRMGYYSDSLAVLALARAKGYIGDNDYFGDLAHLLPAATAAVDQQKILKLLADGNNSFSREVLASLFLDRQIVVALAPAAATDALALLAPNEPTFSTNPTRISGVDILRYGYWMNAVVGLTAQATGEPERSVMARLLKIDGNNPKILIAVLNNQPNAALVRDGFDRQSLEKIDAAIASFAEKSKNDWVQELAAAARTNLVEPKK